PWPVECCHAATAFNAPNCHCSLRTQSARAGDATRPAPIAVSAARHVAMNADRNRSLRSRTARSFWPLDATRARSLHRTDDPRHPSMAPITLLLYPFWSQFVDRSQDELAIMAT